jgi:hypothetical protein
MANFSERGDFNELGSRKLIGMDTQLLKSLRSLFGQIQQAVLAKDSEQLHALVATSQVKMDELEESLKESGHETQSVQEMRQWVAGMMNLADEAGVSDDKTQDHEGENELASDDEANEVDLIAEAIEEADEDAVGTHSEVPMRMEKDLEQIAQEKVDQIKQAHASLAATSDHVVATNAQILSKLQGLKREIENDLQLRISGLQDMISQAQLDYNDHVQTQAQALEAVMEEAQERFGIAVIDQVKTGEQTLQESALKLIQSLDAQAEEAKSRAAAEYAERIREAQVEHETALEAASTQAMESIQAVQSAIESAREAMNGMASQALQEYNTSLIEHSAAREEVFRASTEVSLQELLDTMRSQADAQMSELMQKQDQEFTDLGARHTELQEQAMQEQFAALQKNVSQAQAVATGMSEMINSLQGQITQREEAFRKSLDSHSAEVLENVKVQMDGAAAQTRETAELALDESVARLLDSVALQIDSAASEAKQEIVESAKAAEQSIQQVSAQEQEEIDLVAQRGKLDLEQQLDAMTAKEYEAYQASLRSAAERLLDQNIGAYETEAQSHIDSLRTQIATIVTASKEDLQGVRDQVQSQMDALQALQSELQDSADNGVESIAVALQEQKEVLMAEQAQVDEALARMQEVLGESSDSLSESKNVNEQSSELVASLTGYLAALQAEKSSLTELLESVKDLGDQHNTQILEAKESAENAGRDYLNMTAKWSSEQSDLISQLQGEKESFAEVVASVEGLAREALSHHDRAEELYVSMQEVRDNLLQEGARALDDIEAKDQEFQSEANRLFEVIQSERENFLASAEESEREAREIWDSAQAELSRLQGEHNGMWTKYMQDLDRSHSEHLAHFTQEVQTARGEIDAHLETMSSLLDSGSAAHTQRMSELETVINADRSEREQTKAEWDESVRAALLSSSEAHSSLTALQDSAAEKLTSLLASGEAKHTERMDLWQGLVDNAASDHELRMQKLSEWEQVAQERLLQAQEHAEAADGSRLQAQALLDEVTRLSNAMQELAAHVEGVKEEVILARDGALEAAQESAAASERASELERATHALVQEAESTHQAMTELVADFTRQESQALETFMGLSRESASALTSLRDQYGQSLVALKDELDDSLRERHDAELEKLRLVQAQWAQDMAEKQTQLDAAHAIMNDLADKVETMKDESLSARSEAEAASAEAHLQREAVDSAMNRLDGELDAVRDHLEGARDLRANSYAGAEEASMHLSKIRELLGANMETHPMLVEARKVLQEASELEQRINQHRRKNMFTTIILSVSLTLLFVYVIYPLLPF